MLCTRSQGRTQPAEQIVLSLRGLADFKRSKRAWPNEWPPSKRVPTHATALNACRAALVGEIDVETARDVCGLRATGQYPRTRHRGGP
ncbi:DUF982 domain-containing protein [Ensifer aridi]|uniref:DUF982 domain-containing protein n=1 Tax=Ensifer aridi TaxID=1708715 RepID=UPI00097C9A42